jgi:hypothetical protein
MAKSKERATEKYAWTIIFVFGALWLVAAPINLQGRPPDPPSPSAGAGCGNAVI